MKLGSKGFGVVEIIIVVVIVAGLGLIGWRVFTAQAPSSSQQQNANMATGDEQPATGDVPTEFIWQQTDKGWQSNQTPPACGDQPILSAPADLSKATGILYPGQTRGGNYKPHGGFRFDNSANDSIDLVAPLDGFIVRGGHYIAEGEIQYTFDVFNNCGIMYRVGHLRTLPDSIQKLTTSWPPASADSRTESINPPVYVKQGDKLATAVGIISDQNTFFDLGVYDYRSQNQASQSTNYQNEHQEDKELSWHAVCWFDWLSTSNGSLIKGLPAGDPTSSKSSDYCK